MSPRGLLLAIAVAVAASSVVTGLVISRLAKKAPFSISSNPVIQGIREVGELVVLRIYIREIVESEKNNMKVIWVVSGEGAVSVDLSKAVITVDGMDGRSGTVLLPKPKISFAVVNHKDTQSFTFDKGLLDKAWDRGKVALQLTETVFKKGQMRIKEACGSEDHIRQARLIADALIRGLFESAGFRVDILWQDMAPPAVGDNELIPISLTSQNTVTWRGPARVYSGSSRIPRVHCCGLV